MKTQEAVQAHLLPARASGLRPARMSAHGHITGWLLLAAATQFAWGVYPVAVRFMQTLTPHPLSSLQLAFLINLWTLPGLLVGDLVGCAAAGCSRRRQRKQQQQVAAAAPSSESQALEGEQDEESGPGTQTEDPETIVLPLPPPSRLRKAAVLTATTAALTGLIMGQIYSLRFTAAYMSQMVFLLAPLMVAMIARLLFSQPLPRGLWTALASMLTGAVLVVGGKAAREGGSNAALGWSPAALGATLRSVPGLSVSDAIGLTLALGAALSLAAFMLVVQRSRGLATEQGVLWSYSTFLSVLGCLLTRLLEPVQWAVLGELLPWEWACVAGTALSINWMSNILQQLTIRKLGAPQAAAFLPVRLLGSLAASWPILHEGLGSPVEVAGALLLLASATTYLLAQRSRAGALQQRAGDGSEAAAPLLEGVAEE